MNSTATNVGGSLNERINLAAQALGKSVEQVEQELASILGPKSDEWDELLSKEEFTKFGDFMKAFKDDSETPSPIAIVRKAVGILRGPEEEAEGKNDNPRAKQLKEVLGVKPTMGSADTVDLLNLYMTDKPHDPVSVELRKRFLDRPCIAFVPGTTEVAVNETIAYLTDLRQGMPKQESVMVGGSLSRLYPVGNKPVGTVDEDPLFNGVPLSNNRSTVNHVNWSKVGTEARQLLRIALDRGDLKVDDRLRVIDIVKSAAEGADEIKKIFPEADLEFRDRVEAGTLPNLKVRINGKKSNSPFLGRNRTV